MSSFFWSSSFQCSVDLDVVTGRRLFVLYMCVYVCIERSCFKGSQELMGCRTPNYWRLVFQLIFQFDLIHAPYSWNPMLYQLLCFIMFQQCLVLLSVYLRCLDFSRCFVIHVLRVFVDLTMTLPLPPSVTPP